MTRGVGYAEGFQWQLGCFPAILALFGLGFKYIIEALDWEEYYDERGPYIYDERDREGPFGGFGGGFGGPGGIGGPRF